MITYDYPLNERTRTLLRLEDLFAKIDFFSASAHALDHHAALLSLFEIVEVAARADLKSDLLQELERNRQVLEGYRNNPAISADALDQVLGNITRTSERLLELPGKIGSHLRENEWLMSIKQRTSIPGGICEFDLPSYHYWLSQDLEVRRQALAAWMKPLAAVRDGLDIVLRLLRESGKSARQQAIQGTYQQMLTGKPAQLLRIALSDDYACFPEISANRYMINVRFTSLGGIGRPKICESSIEFDLTLCLV